MVMIDSLALGDVCKRYKPKTTIRTFKGSCGSYTKLHIATNGAIVKTENFHNACKRSCEICVAVTAKAITVVGNSK